MSSRFGLLEEYARAKKIRVHPLLHYQGYIWVIAAFTLIVPALYGLIFQYTSPKEVNVSLVMLDYGLGFLALGLLVSYTTMPSRRLRRDEAIILTIATWLVIPLLVALPVAEALRIPFIDAWFESVSGFTTTGLSMFTGSRDSLTGTYVPMVEQLPKTVLLWRSFIQWVGGVGIVVAAITIITRPGSAARLLYLSEGRSERIEPSAATTAKRVLLVYTIVTVIATLLFYLSGMNWFDAVNHAMAAVATGGFSTKNNSIGEYHSIAIELAAIAAMMFGAISFSDWYNLLIKGRIRRFLLSPELKMLISTTALATLAGQLVLMQAGYTLFQAIRYSLFQVVSSVTTTGFQDRSLADLPDAFKLILIVMSLLGGSAFSTTGGVKQLRLLIAIKSIQWEAASSAAPRGYTPRRKIAWILVSDEDARRAFTVIFTFTLTMIVSTLIGLIIAPQYRLVDMALETASALGNVGISVGITSASMPVALKLLYIADMLLGRLEILPYLFAVYILYSRLVRSARAKRGRRRILEVEEALGYRGESVHTPSL